MSICFGIVALWISMYEPKTLVEGENRSISFENQQIGRATFTERLRIFIALVMLWLILSVVFYHKVAWDAIGEIGKLFLSVV